MKLTLEQAYEQATKGPLFIQGNRICGDGCYPVCGVPRGMSEDGDWTWPSKVAPINAALLVHARNVLPDVVAALERVKNHLEWFETGIGESDVDSLPNAIAALAKASTVEVLE